MCVCVCLYMLKYLWPSCLSFLFPVNIAALPPSSFLICPASNVSGGCCRLSLTVRAFKEVCLTQPAGIGGHCSIDRSQTMCATIWAAAACAGGGHELEEEALVSVTFCHCKLWMKATSDNWSRPWVGECAAWKFDSFKIDTNNVFQNITHTRSGFQLIPGTHGQWTIHI